MEHYTVLNRTARSSCLEKHPNHPVPRAAVSRGPSALLPACSQPVSATSDRIDRIAAVVPHHSRSRMRNASMRYERRAWQNLIRVARNSPIWEEAE
jgi:hypothetical protein